MWQTDFITCLLLHQPTLSKIQPITFQSKFFIILFIWIIVVYYFCEFFINMSFFDFRSTLEVMKEEFKRSHEICMEILDGKANWDKLFETPNFFAKYKHFIVLEVSIFWAIERKHMVQSQSQPQSKRMKTYLYVFNFFKVSSNSEQDQLDWHGLVESKIRHLISNLEKEPSHVQPHIWPRDYPSQIEGQVKLHIILPYFFKSFFLTKFIIFILFSGETLLLLVYWT